MATRGEVVTNDKTTCAICRMRDAYTAEDPAGAILAGIVVGLEYNEERIMRGLCETHHKALAMTAAYTRVSLAPEERREVVNQEAIDRLRARASELRDFANTAPGSEGAVRALKTAEELGRIANQLEQRQRTKRA